MKKQRRVVTGALAVGAALGAASSAEAANFIVTNNLDSGAGSLRDAVDQANANPGLDTVTFNASLTGQTITLTSGDIDISDGVDIQGPGSSNLTVDGNAASRIFYLYAPGAAPVDVTISGLTLTNGFAFDESNFQGNLGGAILAIGEDLTLDDVIVSNSVSAADGGGIAHVALEGVPGPYESPLPVPATLTVRSSEITGNVAEFNDPLADPPLYSGGCGGGLVAIFVSNVLIADNTIVANNAARCDGGGVAVKYLQDGGQFTIQSSTITGNQAGTGEGGGNGGGVAVLSYTFGGYATILDTTISGNTANAAGGGVAALYGAAVDVQRSTVSGNTAFAGGGVVAGPISSVTLENTTVAENSAYYAGAVGVYFGFAEIKETTISTNTTEGFYSGAVAPFYGYGEITITNSIVANTIGAPDLFGSFEVSYSLIEDPGTATITDLGGTVLNEDPALGPLQNNGGPTATMKPANPNVIDGGDPAFAPPPATDQRGFARVVNGVIDMGSLELDPGTLQFSVAAQGVNEDAGTATVTVTRVGGQDGAASVQVAVDGTSTATGGGSDYTFGGVTLNWADNDATDESFLVTIVDDGDDEPAETIVLTLGSATGAAVGAPATHTITIDDNDVVVGPSGADLNVTKTLVPGSLTAGGNATFTITVFNQGPDPATNVVITDTLPPEVTFVSASPSCSGTTTITCSVGTLLSGESTSVQIVVSLSEVGPVTNTANAASDVTDPDGTDNQGSVTFTINARALETIPALDPRMLMLLAALLGASALGIIRKS